MILSFAPMEGVTGADYRRIHREMFGGADVYYSPFIAPDAGGHFKISHLRGLLPENNHGVRLIPQILTNNAAAFLSVAGQLAELGYEEVNLNAGCPSGTVVAKHKGAGMLQDLSHLDAFLSEVFSHVSLSVSVKTRLGLQSTAEFPAILEIYRRYPLSELIIHARDRVGMYQSRVDLPAFAHALPDCPFPVVYNGDLFAPSDLEKLLSELPSLDRVMLGRGAAADPALFRRMRGGAALELKELREFHDRLLDAALAAGLSEAHAMARMKELWFYLIWKFPGSGRFGKALNKSRRLEDYRSAVDALFASGLFDPEAAFGR